MRIASEHGNANVAATDEAHEAEVSPAANGRGLGEDISELLHFATLS